ncbi:MAG TPA: response regulator [Acidimicrobiia bacterium]|nr:response regulator [Acidimicrobiia bacterium]
MKVLIVDDEPEIRDLCKVNLEFAGHDVVTAANGQEAIDYLAGDRPDFVFLDLMMPDVDGWDVLRAIREAESTADVPVVLLTARAAEEDQIRGWEAGIFDYIVKPFNPLSLAEWVEQAYADTAAGMAEHRRSQALEQLRFLQNLR